MNHSNPSGSDASGSNVGSSPTASHCLGKVEPSTITAEYGHAIHVSSYWNFIWHHCFITAILPSDSVSIQCYHILSNSTEDLAS